jgi:hypothetical protein
MKNGRLYNANTLDEIHPKRKKDAIVWNRTSPASGIARY